MEVVRKVVVVLAGLALLVPGSARAGGWWSFVDVRPAGRRGRPARRRPRARDLPGRAAHARAVLRLPAPGARRLVLRTRRRASSTVDARRRRGDSGRARAECAASWPVRPSGHAASLLGGTRSRSAPPAAGGRSGTRCPASLTVVADPATAGLVRRVERLERRVDQQADALWQARDERGRLQAGVRGLRRQLAAQNRRRQPPVVRSAGSGAAVALAGAALLAAVSASSSSGGGAAPRVRPRPWPKRTLSFVTDQCRNRIDSATTGARWRRSRP